MNRNPIKGDIIVIGKSHAELLVINAERAVWVDSARLNDEYWANVFDVVPIRDTPPDGRFVEANAKVTRYMTDGCMTAGKRVNINDIQLVGTCKFRTVVTTEYVISRSKGV